MYILRLREEKLGSLAEISEAQNISEQMLDLPEDTDFLSVPMMSEYFQKLYQNAQKRNYRDMLRYPLKDTVDQDILNLLALNCERIKPNRNPHLQFCGQAFKTAGARCEVIDLIVPYNREAEDLIAQLGSEHNPKTVTKLLRQAQKYAVSIYEGARRKLDQEAAIHTLCCGPEQSCSVQILDKRFYHADYGITLEGGEHEVLLL